MNARSPADVLCIRMWRALLITMLVLQQSFAALLVPTSAPSKPIEESPAQCCCCQAPCDAMPRGCDTDAPRRCAPSGTQRPLNSDATNTSRSLARLLARLRAGDPDKHGASTGPARIATRQLTLATNSSRHDPAPGAPLDARTRRALLCVRTT